MSYFKKHALIIAIILSITFAVTIPGLGKALYPSGITNLILALIFLCQGLGVKSDELNLKWSTFGALALGAVFSLLLDP